MTTHTRTHAEIAFANPNLRCDQCDRPTPTWHDDEECGCGQGWWNNPCGHRASITSVCPSWCPVDGCTCTTASGRRLHHNLSKEQI